MTQPRSLLDIISRRGGALDELVRCAARTDRLGRRVAALLPAEVGDHVLSASVQEDVLVVITDASAWAARVRFEGTTLVERIRAGGVSCRALRVKVRAPMDPRERDG
ncbi:hypothetical protein BH24PSE2_BH24PSE2_06450 [soil metagenome]